MEIVAHGLWAGAAVICTKRRLPNLSFPQTIWWAVFPDVLAFAPSLAVGLWLRLSGTSNPAEAHSLHLPHAHLGLPLYLGGHSLIVFLLVFVGGSTLLRRPAWALCGWAFHILIDIPTHSVSYYATRFLWPLSDFGLDGIPWWTTWVWAGTYLSILAVYLILWRHGWLDPAGSGLLRTGPPARQNE
jgi:hypothetical protein